jgi:putative transcriptional regulator
MNKDLFQELLESVREGGAILRGEARPGRAFAVDEPDVTAIRNNYKLSQQKFASLLGISTRTLQNWEQKRRRPEGSARVLLQVAARHPEAILDVVSSEIRATTLGALRMRSAGSRKAASRQSGDANSRTAAAKQSGKAKRTSSAKRARTKASRR